MSLALPLGAGAEAQRVTDDEWRLAIRRQVLQRQQHEFQDFRELIDLNLSLAAEVKLLKQQLHASQASFVDLAEGEYAVSAAGTGGGAANPNTGGEDGETGATTGSLQEQKQQQQQQQEQLRRRRRTSSGASAGGRGERRWSTDSSSSSSSSSSSAYGGTTTGGGAPGGGGAQVARLQQQVKSLQGQLSALQQREVEFNRMRARVAEAEEQLRLKDQRHSQSLLFIRNQQRFLKMHQEEARRKTESMELLQQQCQANERQIVKHEAHINQLVTENEKIVTRLIADKTKVQQEMNSMNALCDALKKQLLDTEQRLQQAQDRTAGVGRSLHHRQQPQGSFSTGGSSSGSDSSASAKGASAASGEERGMQSLIHMYQSAASEAVPAVVAGRTRLNVKELTDFSMDPEATVLASADAQRGAVCLWKLSQGWKEDGNGAPFSLQNMARLPRACSVEWHEPFTLATAIGDNNAYLMPNTRGGKHVALTGHSAAALCVCGTRDHQKVLSGALDGWARIWDVATAKVITSFDCARGLPRAPCTAVAFSADGTTAALGYKNHVIAVWDCRVGKQTVQRLATRDLHEDAITSLAFAPGPAAPGTPLRLLSAGRDSCLRVFDARSAAGREDEALTLTCPGFRISAPTTKACFSPEGRFAAAGSGSGDVVVWDTLGKAGGKAVKKFRTHSQEIASCFWSTDKSLYVGDQSGAIVRLSTATKK